MALPELSPTLARIATRRRAKHTTLAGLSCLRSCMNTATPNSAAATIPAVRSIDFQPTEKRARGPTASRTSRGPARRMTAPIDVCARRLGSSAKMCTLYTHMRTAYTSSSLNRERVLEAASRVAEREGFQRLSMRVVARELDVSPMALYRHVADRDDLLDGLVERLLGEVRLPDESQPWQERLRSLAQELRALASRHPELFGLLLRRRAVGTEALRARQAAIGALCDSGLDLDAATKTERLLSTMIFGFAFSEAAGRFEGLNADAEFEALLDLLAQAVSA